MLDSVLFKDFEVFIWLGSMYMVTVYNITMVMYTRVARFSTFFSDRLGTNGKSCVPMPVKEPYNLFDLG